MPRPPRPTATSRACDASWRDVISSSSRRGARNDQVRLIATKSLGDAVTAPRLHLNVTWIPVTDPQPTNRRDLYQTAAGHSQHVSDHTALVVDYVRRENSAHVSDTNLIKAGFRHEIADNLALKSPVISYHGKFWHFDNLRLIPRPVQQPAPPLWVTVVSVASARNAAWRGAKLGTGFHPLNKAVEIFDAFRDEADKVGRKVGPDDLCIRRQVTIMKDDRDVAAVLDTQRRDMRKFLEADPRLDAPGRPAILDTPTAHAFSIGNDEFVAGTVAAIVEQVVGQRHAAGAGNLAATFDRSRPPERLKEWYVESGADVIPRLRQAAI